MICPKGQIIHWAQLATIFGRGHIGRGHIDPASKNLAAFGCIGFHYFGFSFLQMDWTPALRLQFFIMTILMELLVVRLFLGDHLFSEDSYFCPWFRSTF
jgi:hypothetical protein